MCQPCGPKRAIQITVFFALALGLAAFFLLLYFFVRVRSISPPPSPCNKPRNRHARLTHLNPHTPLSSPQPGADIDEAAGTIKERLMEGPQGKAFSRDLNMSYFLSNTVSARMPTPSPVRGCRTSRHGPSST